MKKIIFLIGYLANQTSFQVEYTLQCILAVPHHKNLHQTYVKGASPTGKKYGKVFELLEHQFYYRSMMQRKKYSWELQLGYKEQDEHYSSCWQQPYNFPPLPPLPKDYGVAQPFSWGHFLPNVTHTFQLQTFWQ